MPDLLTFILDIVASHVEPETFTDQRRGTFLHKYHLGALANDRRAYLHHIVRSDIDDFHDHPWENTSVILAGGYWEVTPEGRWWRARGDVIQRSARALHRIELEPGLEPWSLFITGPKVREWGFQHPQCGWMEWRPYLAMKLRDAGLPVPNHLIETEAAAS